MYCIRFVMIYNNYRVRGVSMRMKSKYLKRWNLPPYGVKLDSIKSKPYPVLIAILFLGAALISLNQKVIGIAILVLACYQLGIGNNSVLCEFYDRYVVFYSTQDPDGCYILFWQDVAKWQYQCGLMQDTLRVLLKDGSKVEFSSLSPGLRHLYNHLRKSKTSNRLYLSMI